MSPTFVTFIAFAGKLTKGPDRCSETHMGIQFPHVNPTNTSLVGMAHTLPSQRQVRYLKHLLIA